MDSCRRIPCAYMGGLWKEDPGRRRKGHAKCFVLTPQRNTIELESNIESSVRGRLERWVEADTDVAQAYFVHEALETFAGRVCPRRLHFNLVA